jgi:hypothetical protein
MSLDKRVLISLGSSIILRSLPYKTPDAFFREVCLHGNCNARNISRHGGYELNNDLRKKAKDF